MADLERITLAIDSKLLQRFDRLLVKRGLGNRSEAVRDLIRARLVAEEATSGNGEAVASLTAAIEPLMIIFLGVIVGMIVAGMFLPLFKIIGTLSVQ